MSLDFGDLKNILRKFDHKMIVTEGDATFTDPAIFEPEGVVVITGKGPSVENVAIHAFDEVVAHIQAKFPGQDKSYTIEVIITETENNIFSVKRSVTV
jgi:6-pyruvoyl-tetrahydropterin synthase